MNSNPVNLSPWVHELDHSRETKQIHEDFGTDVAIIGGGISGLVSAFFTLQNTDKSVTLIEAGKIGRGATGHNAGQVVDYFEKPFFEMVEEYGLPMASHAQKAISSAWDLLEFILQETQIKINYSKFVGYAGCSDLEQLNAHLENKRLKAQGGIEIQKVRVSEEFNLLDSIPPEYRDLYDIVPASVVQELLETKSNEYIAVLQSHKGCLNSALFVEKLSAYLLENYADRYLQFEHAPVSNIDLFEEYALLHVGEIVIDAKRIVLCTNGFSNIHIENRVGENIDKKYHDMVYGRVGFMAGYVEDKARDPIAISYLPEKATVESHEDPYYYLTRRNHSEQGKSLVCIGGPEEIKDSNFTYSVEIEYPHKVKNDLQTFLGKSFKHTPEEFNEFKYAWHGLMGYTNSGIRCVGPEPTNEILLYNLGCNGIGILPSIYGSKKISEHLNGDELEETIFDPAVQRRVAYKRNILKNIRNFAIVEEVEGAPLQL